MALKLESELKKLTLDANKYANTQELNWISKNADLLEETIKGEPLLYPESVTEFPFALGGLVYALKELDDTARKRLANAFANNLVESAKERVPHLEYIMNDYLTWSWFNPLGVFKREMNAEPDWEGIYPPDKKYDIPSPGTLEGFIAQEKEFASRDLRVYINANSYINWKINDLTKNLIKHSVKKETHHIDIIYYLFNKFEYEGYGRVGKIGDTVTKKEHRSTIKKRLQNIHKAKLPHLETVFKIWK